MHRPLVTVAQHARLVAGAAVSHQPHHAAAAAVWRTAGRRAPALSLGVWALGIHSLPAAAPGSRLWVQLKGCLPVRVSTNDCEIVDDFAHAVKGWHLDLLADVSVARVGLYASRRGKCSSEHQLEELRRGMSLEELRTNPDFESNSDYTPIIVKVLPPPKAETKTLFLEEKRKKTMTTSTFRVTEATFKTLMLKYGGFKLQDNRVVLEFDTLENGKTYVATFDHSLPDYRLAQARADEDEINARVRTHLGADAHLVSGEILDAQGRRIIEFDGAFRLPHWIALVEAKHQVRKEHIDEFPSRIEKFRRLQQDPSVRMDDRLRDTHCDIQGYIGGQFFPLQLRNYAKSLGLIAVTKNGGAFGIEDC